MFSTPFLTSPYFPLYPVPEVSGGQFLCPLGIFWYSKDSSQFLILGLSCLESVKSVSTCPSAFQLSKYCINLYPRLSRTYLEPKLYETMYSCTFSCIFIRLKSLLYEIIFYNTITRTNLLLILSYCLIK